MTESEHLFTVLAEECAEVAKCCSKINRFGLYDYHPSKELETGPTNEETLILELNDLMASVELLQDKGLICRNFFRRELIEAKKEKVKRFLEYSRSKGLIQDENSSTDAV